jgi:tetratricopeptide (TPR) repeat protein
VAVLDAFGLNDYVIARHQLHRGEFRQMAHDRFPPPGYLESFSVNYGRMANETSGFMARDYDLTADEIVTTEQYWTDRIVHGRDVAYSYAMLNRIAESYIRTAEPGKAAGFLEQAIALEPTRSRAFVNLGEYYSRIDRVDSSLALLRVAHQLDADDPLIQTRLGRAYAAVGYDLMDRDPETAQTMLDSAGICLSGVLAFTPDQVEALVAQASILLYRDQIDSSAVLLAQLEKLEIAADDIKLLGDRYLYKDRRDLALRAYRTAIGNDLNQQLVDELLDAHPELNE